MLSELKENIKTYINKISKNVHRQNYKIKKERNHKKNTQILELKTQLTKLKNFFK